MWSVPTRGTVSVADDSSTSTSNSFLKVLFFFFGGVLVDFLFAGCRGLGVFVLVCLRSELVNKGSQFLRIVVSSWFFFFFFWYIVQ